MSLLAQGELLDPGLNAARVALGAAAAATATARRNVKFLRLIYTAAIDNLDGFFVGVVSPRLNQADLNAFLPGVGGFDWRGYGGTVTLPHMPAATRTRIIVEHGVLETCRGSPAFIGGGMCVAQRLQVVDIDQCMQRLYHIKQINSYRSTITGQQRHLIYVFADR